MWFTRSRIDIFSKYFADISKILVASIVVGFFVPSSGGVVSIPVFAGGILAAIGFLIFSVAITE